MKRKTTQVVKESCTFVWLTKGRNFNRGGVVRGRRGRKEGRRRNSGLTSFTTTLVRGR